MLVGRKIKLKKEKQRKKCLKGIPVLKKGEGIFEK